MTSDGDSLDLLGYLTDKQIKAELDAGRLIEEGTWEAGQLRHASYTVRLGDRVEVSRAASTVLSEVREFTIVNLTSADAVVELRPGDTALLYSIEHLRFPANMLGFTVARGLLFVEALCPENTYVDPGFCGRVYITVTNVSGRVVHLKYAMPIARLFFYRLSRDVHDGYKAGSALGISQQLKSVRTTVLSTPSACRTASDDDLMGCIQQIPIGGIHVAEVLRRRGNTDGQLWVAIASWPLLLLVVASSDWVRTHIGVFAGSVLASVVATGIIYAVPMVSRILARK